MAALLGFLLTVAPGLCADSPPNHIPPVAGTTFAGQPLRLPEGLNGRVAVLVLGFSQTSRAPITDWGRRLAGDFYGSASVAYYEMPVLESVPRVLRGFVLGRIKDSISDRARPTFLPLLDHEAEWKKTVGFTKEDDAYVLLVDAQGGVRWRTQGPIADAAYAELKRQIAALQPHPQAAPTTLASPARP
jgi:hypothetical protein